MISNVPQAHKCGCVNGKWTARSVTHDPIHLLPCVEQLENCVIGRLRTTHYCGPSYVLRNVVEVSAGLKRMDDWLSEVSLWPMGNDSTGIGSSGINQLFTLQSLSVIDFQEPNLCIGIPLDIDDICLQTYPIDQVIISCKTVKVLMSCRSRNESIR